MKNIEEKCVLQVCAYAAPYEGNFIPTLRTLAYECEKYGGKTIFAFPENGKFLPWMEELRKKYMVYFLPLSQARVRLKTYQIMKRIYKENNITIAHSHFELYDIPVTMMAPKNTKIFWHLHDALDLIYRKSGRLYRVLWKIQYALVSKRATLLSVSEQAKQFAIQLGFSKERAYFIPNGIDLKRINAEMKSGNQRYDFLIFAWDYYRKGVDVLVNAVKQMKIHEFTCGVVSDKEEWKKGDCVICKNLIQQDPVSNVSELYSQSKCFLHISRYEGLSYALLEAIYAGCIVICSDIEQNMFAKKFPTVYFVPVGDSSSLCEAMEKVLNGDFTVTKEALVLSREFIKNEYSLENWTNTMKKMYFR